MINEKSNNRLMLDLQLCRFASCACLGLAALAMVKMAHDIIVPGEATTKQDLMYLLGMPALVCAAEQFFHVGNAIKFELKQRKENGRG